ncbi:hypothetical protein CGLO_12487 [Colletotrichum gloeosporioides Cg-14]|uniref:Uncharacterized protein n=1 Tax=Colletotrichum gloeosporioides (strain Cg-14) TaxID=1237896 RepID=T0K5Q3_COLGC|nr:hypothetical protein CGLO_12487 [Colletotrichum gloeosporioides Cg-14]
MGGVILSPSAMPASTGLSEAPTPTPAGDINFGRLFQRDEDTAQILITQTVTRSWTTYVTVETLHGGLPAEPTARSSSGLSGKQLGIILGSVLGGVLVLSLIGCYFLCRRWKYWHKGRIPRSHTTSPYARTKPKFSFFTPEFGICVYSWYPPEPSFSFNLSVFPFFGSSRASAGEATSRLFRRLQRLVRRRRKAG